jgi:hypothetical protein
MLQLESGREIVREQADEYALSSQKHWAAGKYQ